MNDFDIHQWQKKHLNSVNESTQTQESYSDEALDRMNGLVSQPLLQTYMQSVKDIISELHDEGFEADEVMYFLIEKMKLIRK